MNFTSPHLTRQVSPCPSESKSVWLGVPPQLQGRPRSPAWGGDGEVAGNPLPSSVGTTVLTEGGPQRLVTSETPRYHPTQAFQGTLVSVIPGMHQLHILAHFIYWRHGGVPRVGIFQGHPSNLSPWEDTP